MQGGRTALPVQQQGSDDYFEDLVTERLIPVPGLFQTGHFNCTGGRWAVINCLRSLIQRKHEHIKANFNEWKCFPSAGQVIIQPQSDTPEPASRRS